MYIFLKFRYKLKVLKIAVIFLNYVNTVNEMYRNIYFYLIKTKPPKILRNIKNDIYF